MRNRVLSSWLGVAGAVFLAIDAHAQTINSWISPTNGFWEESAKWSLGVSPTNSHSIYITNALTKTVTVDNFDVTSFPSTLTITNLTVGGTGGATNTLQLANMSAGGPTPLHVLATCRVNPGGVLLITNSTLRVDGTPGGADFEINGDVLLQSGALLATNSFAAIMMGVSGAGRLRVQDGSMQAQTIYVGFNAGSPGTLTVAGGTMSIAYSLFVGWYPGATGTVWVTGGSLEVTNAFTTIGESGSGQMTVSNGTVRLRRLNVGQTAGSQGTLTIAGGTTVVSQYLDIGSLDTNATGRVWVTGGQLVLTNAATVIGDVGDGQMTVSNGTVLATNVTVGSWTTARGTLRIAGGTMALNGPLRVGIAANNSTGTVWVTGGQLVVTNNPAVVGAGTGFIVDGPAILGHGSIVVSNLPTVVGNYGDGTLTITGGTMQVTGPLTVGQNGGVGRIFVDGGRLVATNDFSLFGVLSRGDMTVSSGEVEVASTAFGADVGGSGSTLRMVGGKMHTYGNLIFGGPSAGALWMTGGELSNIFFTVGGSGGQATVSNGVLRAHDLTVGQFFGGTGRMALAGGAVLLSDAFVLGSFAGATGEVWVTGGKLIADGVSNSSRLGNQGVGRMTVSNGVVLVNQLNIGTFGSDAFGTLTMAGGLMIATNAVTVGYGCSATGIVEVVGGSLFITNATHTAVLHVRSGTVTHTGGTFVIDRLIVTNACARFISTGPGLSVGSMLLEPGLDADGDGLPNTWETFVGLDPLSPSGDDGADGDPDGDGFTNAEEFAACTDPLDSSSLPAIKSIAIAGDDVVIHIDTHCQGYTYQLRRRAAIETAPWVDVPGPGAVAIGNGGDVELRHVNGALNGKQFYQVRISPPGP